MSAIFKFAIASTLVVILGSIISALIPDAINGSINSAIIYFLSFLGTLNFLFNVDTLFICMKILVNFMLSVSIFVLARWFMHLFLA